MDKDEAIRIARATLIKDFGRDLPLSNAIEILPCHHVFFQKIEGVEVPFDDRMFKVESASSQEEAIAKAREILRERTGCELPVKYASRQNGYFDLSFMLDKPLVDVHHITFRVDATTGCAALVKSI